MTALSSSAFPEDAVRARAGAGRPSVFPDLAGYGRELYGAAGTTADPLERMRLVPPVFMPSRLEKLIDLGREPDSSDVDTTTDVGGIPATLPLYVSAFGSTSVAATGAGLALARQAARAGIPLVIGENVVPVDGYRAEHQVRRSLQQQLLAYAEALDGSGGVVVQQSTEDADSEVWNAVYADPALESLLRAGRLAFELKLGQGAKPGLGGMTVVGTADARRLATAFRIEPVDGEHALRVGSPGTFTADVLTHQIRLMRNNYPLARTWVKLPPGRDVAEAARVAWCAGADAVTVDGAEGGTGWAPTGVMESVGLPLGECLRRVRPGGSCLLASGRVWEAVRAVKCLALGARAVGLGRAALLAVDTDHDAGLTRLVEAFAWELRLVTAALGRYRTGDVAPDDLWMPGEECAVDDASARERTAR